MLSRLAVGVAIGATIVGVVVTVLWKEIEHLLVATFAASIAYRILRHRYFPKHPHSETEKR